MAKAKTTTTKKAVEEKDILKRKKLKTRWLLLKKNKVKATPLQLGSCLI